MLNLCLQRILVKTNVNELQLSNVKGALHATSQNNHRKQQNEEIACYVLNLLRLTLADSKGSVLGE